MSIFTYCDGAGRWEYSKLSLFVVSLAVLCSQTTVSDSWVCAVHHVPSIRTAAYVIVHTTFSGVFRQQKRKLSGRCTAGTNHCEVLSTGKTCTKTLSVLCAIS